MPPTGVAFDATATRREPSFQTRNTLKIARATLADAIKPPRKAGSITSRLQFAAAQYKPNWLSRNGPLIHNRARRNLPTLCSGWQIPGRPGPQARASASCLELKHEAPGTGPDGHRGCAGCLARRIRGPHVGA